MPAPGPASGTSCFRREGRRPAWRKWSSWASNGARTRVDLLHGFSWPASMLACFNAPLLRSQQKYFPMLRWTAGSRTYGLACAQFQPSPLTPRAKCHPDDGASLFMSTIAPALLPLLQMAFQHYSSMKLCARARNIAGSNQGAVFYVLFSSIYQEQDTSHAATQAPPHAWRAHSSCGETEQWLRLSCATMV